MRKFKYLLLIIFIITSCNLSQELNYKSEMEFDTNFNTLQDVFSWIDSNITYYSDEELFESKEYWQSPIQTYVWKAGDCEDFSILAMYLIHTYLNVDKTEIKMVIGETKEYGHAWINVNGIWYEPQSGQKCNGNKEKYFNIRELSYKEVMRRATTTHRSLSQKMLKPVLNGK